VAFCPDLGRGEKGGVRWRAAGCSTGAHPSTAHIYIRQKIKKYMKGNNIIDLIRFESNSGRPAYKNRKLKRFLRGPIPLDWIATAARLPGKSLHVAITLYYWQGLRRSHKVRMSMALLKDFGVSRWAAYRGLAALERAGLVHVERLAGRSPRVEIIRPNTVPADSNQEVVAVVDHLLLSDRP